jgi:hypothetical protein
MRRSPGDRLREGQPAGGLLVAPTVLADPPQAGGANEATVRPVVRIELPDAGVRLVPALLDRLSSDLGGAPLVRPEVVVAGDGGEEQQRFADGVELKLVADPIPDDRSAAGVPGQVEVTLVGDRVAGDRVRGCEPRACVEQPVADEAHGIVHEGMRADGCDGLPGVALVADPHVSVVVVATLAGAFGQ